MGFFGFKDINKFTDKFISNELLKVSCNKSTVKLENSCWMPAVVHLLLLHLAVVRVVVQHYLCEAFEILFMLQFLQNKDAKIERKIAVEYTATPADGGGQ